MPGGLKGADGDHIDCFIGPDLNSELVFVVDQVDPNTGRFDEHKVLIGFSNFEDAEAGYLANYEKGWKGLGDMTAMTIDQFKSWLAEGDLTKPINGQQIKLADYEIDELFAMMGSCQDPLLARL